MKIETKFDIGQEVYVIDNHKRRINIIPCKVISIQTNSSDSHTAVNYYCITGCLLFWSEENKTFATKEEAEAKLKEMQDE